MATLDKEEYRWALDTYRSDITDTLRHVTHELSVAPDVLSPESSRRLGQYFSDAVRLTEAILKQDTPPEFTAAVAPLYQALSDFTQAATTLTRAIETHDLGLMQDAIDSWNRADHSIGAMTTALAPLRRHNMEPEP